MKVRTYPDPRNAGNAQSGINTLLAKYALHFPKHDIEMVHGDDFDVVAVHAGTLSTFYDVPIVAHLHGLYWSADYWVEPWEHKANRDVINSIRRAHAVTVPSPWVSKTLQRDMHLDPFVVPHGIDLDEWEPTEHNGYVLWNKNRAHDVCDPKWVGILARRFPELRFLTTFAPADAPPNVKAIGVVSHETMRDLVRHALVYLSTTKETFGIGTLEALASAVPVLGFRHGGTADLVEHLGSGYLAKSDSEEELAVGMRYCLRNRNALGKLARARASGYTWDSAIEKVRAVYEYAIQSYAEPHDVTVVIPCYNKAPTLERAVDSAYAQTFQPKQVIVVNNNSTDQFAEVVERLREKYPLLVVLNETRQGVAHARNLGIESASSRHVCCLDADDEIELKFLAVCVGALRNDSTLGLAYTRLKAIAPDGTETVSQWPGAYNFDGFIQRKNQVPTCCVFRRDIALRLGGFRQRYAPRGAGAEDAEFWMRIGASGFAGILASNEALFRYHIGGSTSEPGYQEPDWHAWHPWTKDFQHPFASVAAPRELAHLVRQYDEPEISVVIPVADYHTQIVRDALDSLEAQTLRRWEAILVNNSDADLSQIVVEYPFVTLIDCEKRGAGAARNAGARVAKGKFLLFLDADDVLIPSSTRVMLDAYEGEPGIVYGPFIGRARLSQEAMRKFAAQNRVVSYDAKSGEAAIFYPVSAYNCEEAQAQPRLQLNGQFYIWSLICSMVPRSWHNEIGGFDEAMESWEDWDYWIRMARAGKCFTHVDVPLVHYRFDTGARRSIANPDESGEDGRQVSEKLVSYLQAKYAKEEPVPCSGCGGRRRTAPVAIPPIQEFPSMPQTAGAPKTMTSSDLVKVRLTDGVGGDHPVAMYGVPYGYRSPGDVFYIHRDHLGPFGSKVQLVDESVQEPVVPVETVEQEPESDDLTTIWGIGDNEVGILAKNNVTTREGLLATPASVLASWLSIKKNIAARILNSAAK